ncbi:hypothetical protein [Streptomyces europaeiscabiei]|uniref:hypothetical protein n=1 Tax=Streptomyces europaeiscabiei TaxID=146819 RepID=UPI0029B12FA8|nr:hypothetical protein [Streptomyces europaeiscabiei]MDX3868007.1 hypothetical protein [Streptomyces europaeiscabiei]
MTDRTEPTARELRQLLAVVLEALDIPAPATVGDGETHRGILDHRTMDAVAALRGVLHQDDDPGWSADYLRARLAEKPATGYRSWGTVEDVPADPADESERVRRSVDGQFPAVARFLADERAREAGEGR